MQPSIKNRHSALPTGDFQKDLIAAVPNLRAFARALCHHRDLADDLVQDSLVRAWGSRDRFEPGSNLLAWLFTILRNRFYSHRRRSWREADWSQVGSDLIRMSPESLFLSLELSDTAHALHALPDVQREAVILVGAGGFSYEDAARICNVPVGTMKSRVARGRTCLMEILDARQACSRHPSVARNGAFQDVVSQIDTLVRKDAQASSTRNPPAEAGRAELSAGL